MKSKTLRMLLGAFLLACLPPVRADGAKPSAAAGKAAPAARTLEQMLAFIPEDVVSIDGSVRVKRGELVAVMKPQLEQAVRQGVDVPEKDLRKFASSLARKLGVQLILVEHARAQGIALDRSVPEKLLREYRDKAGEKVFGKMLERENIDLETLVTRLAEMNAIKKWQDGILAKAPAVTEKECRDFYDRNQAMFKVDRTFSASHILVKFSGKNPSDNEKKNAMARIRRIRQELLDGADFAQLARKESDCPSKTEGGSLGEFPEGRMVPEFEDALRKLKENEISEPVETRFGYHVIKAGPQKGPGVKTFPESEKKIRSILTQQRDRRIMEKTVDDIVRKRDLQVLLK